jgi:type I restriction enzyme S subunit
VREYLLSDIAEIVDCEHKTASKVENSEYYSIRTTDITNGKIIFQSANRVSEETYLEWIKRATPESGSIILAREAPVGEVGWIKEGYKVCLGQRTVLIKVNHKDVSSKFILYYLVNPDTKYDLQSRSTGSVVAHLNMKDIRAFKIVVPALAEQQSIASVLSSLDDKIDLLHRQNKTLEAMAETLFRQWFDDKECDGEISQLIGIQNGYAFKSSDFKEIGENGVLKIKNISDGIIDIKKTDFIDGVVAANTQDRFKVAIGDVLIGMTGAEIGKLGIVPKTNKSLWLNQRVGILREKYPGAKYLAYIQLKSEFGQDYIENTATGSAQPNISGTGIEGCGFLSIDEETIRDRCKQIAPLYKKLVFNLGQIESLEKLRDSLLPKLMSGEMRVAI